MVPSGFFVLQELPYLVMPMIPPDLNPLMEMQDRSAILNMMEKSLGISCIISLIFLVHNDASPFSAEIDAGALTGVAALWACAFYRRRQRKWRRLLKR